MSPNDSSPKKIIVKTCCLCACHLQLRCCLASVSSPRLQPQGSTPAQHPSSTDPVPASILCIHYHNLLEPGPVWNATGGTLLAPNSHQLQLFWHHILTNCHSFGITFSPIATFWASHSNNCNFFWHHILTNWYLNGSDKKEQSAKILRTIQCPHIFPGLS